MTAAAAVTGAGAVPATSVTPADGAAVAVAPDRYPWTYLRAYPARGALGMDAAFAAAAEFGAESLARGANRWFAIRYFDLLGAHVRLRVQAPADVLDVLHDVCRAMLLPRLGADTEAAEPPAVAPGHLRVAYDPPAPRGAWVRGALYEPEVDKYGEGAALSAAHQMFQVSSEVAARLCLRTAFRPVLRVAGAVGLLASGVACLPPAERDAFHDAHLAYWGGSRPAGPAGGADPALDATRAAARCWAGRLRGVEPCAATVEDLGRYRRALAQALLPAGAERDRRTALVLHHTHMTMNRLGLLPPDEAVVGLLARVSGLPTTVPGQVGAGLEPLDPVEDLEDVAGQLG